MGQVVEQVEEVEDEVAVVVERDGDQRYVVVGDCDEG